MSLLNAANSLRASRVSLKLITMPTKSNSNLAYKAAIAFGKRINGGLNRLLIRLRPFICPFEDLLEAVPFDIEILDVGCGSGFWLYLVWMHKKPRYLTGVDPSRTKILSAKNAFSSISTPSSFLIQSDPDLWPNNKYGMVSMIDVLHHIPPASQERFFRSAASRVGDGGIFLYKDMCCRPFWKAVFNQVHDLIFAQQWIHHIDCKKVESWAADEGFVLKTKADRTLYCYGHEFRCFARPSK